VNKLCHQIIVFFLENCGVGGLAIIQIELSQIWLHDREESRKVSEIKSSTDFSFQNVVFLNFQRQNL
jgi:hypothetical protein